MDFLIMNLAEITNISYTELLDTDEVDIWTMYGIKNVQRKIDKFWAEIDNAKAKLKRK